MSTAAVSSSSIHQQFHQYLQSRSADLEQLGKALSSGDLAGAQTAFNKIVALGKNSPFGDGNSFKLTQRAQDFAAVGQALQSGDLAGAKQAFQGLVNTFRDLPRNGGAPTSATPTASSGPDIVLNISNRGGNANPEQITININESDNSGAQQVATNTGSQPSPLAQQITLNVNPADTEQIVINLLEGPASTSSANNSANGISVSA